MACVTRGVDIVSVPIVGIWIWQAYTGLETPFSIVVSVPIVGIWIWQGIIDWIAPQMPSSFSPDSRDLDLARN